MLGIWNNKKKLYTLYIFIFLSCVKIWAQIVEVKWVNLW